MTKDMNTILAGEPDFVEECQDTRNIIGERYVWCFGFVYLTKKL